MKIENNKARKRSKRGLGRLYKRDTKGKEYPPSSKVKGTFYVDYYITTEEGKSKRVREKLFDDDKNPVTDLGLAREIHKKIVTPFLLKSNKEKLEELEAKIKKTNYLQDIAEKETRENVRFTDAWNIYLSSNSRPDTGKATLINYRRHLEKFINWLSDEYPKIKKIQEITLSIANDYIKLLEKEELTGNTINKHVGFLKLFYNTMLIDRKADHNPFQNIRRKKYKSHSRKVLRVDEISTLIQEAQGDMALFFALAYFTGLRRGDCCTLKWSEIHLNRKVILRIPNKISRRSENTEPVKVGINNILYSLLTKIPPGQRSEYLFPQIAEWYINQSTRDRINRMIKKHFMKCGIKLHKDGTGPGTGKRAIVEYGFHSLRHSYISHLAELGTPQAVLQANAGHKNPAMTEHYTKVSDDVAVSVSNSLTLSVPNLNPIQCKIDEAIALLSISDEEKKDHVLALLKGD